MSCCWWACLENRMLDESAVCFAVGDRFIWKEHGFRRTYANICELPLQQLWGPFKKFDRGWTGIAFNVEGYWPRKVFCPPISQACMDVECWIAHNAWVLDFKIGFLERRIKIYCRFDEWVPPDSLQWGWQSVSIWDLVCFLIATAWKSTVKVIKYVPFIWWSLRNILFWQCFVVWNRCLSCGALDVGCVLRW